jgi:hypothetical protein
MTSQPFNFQQNFPCSNGRHVPDELYNFLPVFLPAAALSPSILHAFTSQSLTEVKKFCPGPHHAEITLFPEQEES